VVSSLVWVSCFLAISMLIVLRVIIFLNVWYNKDITKYSPSGFRSSPDTCKNINVNAVYSIYAIFKLPSCFLRFILILSSHLCLSVPSDLFPWGFLTKILYFLSLPHVLHVHSMYPPWFDHTNNILWSVEVTKLLIMQSSPASCHLLPPRSWYSPQQPVLKHPQSTFLP
jgi:hypothetical protein